MSERADAIRALLATAAGPKGQGDKGWHAAGTRRLYFEDPTDIDAAGMVDVNENDGGSDYVRVELWVSPKIAAEIIAHVTGNVQLTARVLVDQELERLQREREQVEQTEKVHGDGLDVSKAILRLEAEDDARNAMLDEAIRATGGLMAPDEDEVPATEVPAAKPEANELERLIEEQTKDDEDNGAIEKIFGDEEYVEKEER